jgi:hypothetical protein
MLCFLRSLACRDSFLTKERVSLKQYTKWSNEKANEINHRVCKVKIVNWNSFKIGDTRAFTPYNRNGLCNNLKMPKRFNSRRFLIAVRSSMPISIPIYQNIEKMGDSFKDFLLFQALALFKKI